jgi:hypothetical protein
MSWCTRSIRRLVLAAVVSATAVAASPAAPAHAGPILLPFQGFGGMVIDAAHDRLFVSGGTGHDQIAVYDLAGTWVKTFTNMPGASDMVVHRGVLYAALFDGGAIGRIDTASLTRMKRVGLRTLSAPRYLAIAAGRIWVSTCTAGVVASFATDGTDLVLESGFGTVSNDCWDLESTPAKPRVIFAGETYGGPTSLVKLKAATDGSLTNLLEVSDPGLDGSDSVDDMAIRHDGAQVMLACGAPYYVEAFSTASFGSQRTWPTGPYPVAVDVSSDDAQVAAGAWAPGGPDVFVFPFRGQTPTFSYDFNSGSEQLADGGLLFGPDAATLYAVSGSFDTGDETLHLLDPNAA